MPVSPTCDLFIVTGEASGDAYGAALLEVLRARHPELVCAAMGGPALTAAGAEIEQDSEGLAVIGLGPVLARLPEFIRLGLRMAAVIRARRPKVVLTIDYPGFNLRLVRRLADLRRQGTRFLHVVAPQVWAWKPRRAKAIAQSVDRLFCFFPFEPPLFNRFTGRAGFTCAAEFVGHPLLDLIPARVASTPLSADLGVGRDERLLLLAPGSRAREVETLLPRFHQTAEAFLRRTRGRIAVAVAKVPDLPVELYRRHTHFPLIDGHYRELCARAHAGLIASGTATLEAAIIGLPHVIAYRTDRLTAMLARQLIRTQHIGLPNLVLNERLLPEVLQDQCTVPRLVAHLERLWSGETRAQTLAGLTRVRSALGDGGAIVHIADAIAADLAIGRRKETQAFDVGRSDRLATAAP